MNADSLLTAPTVNWWLNYATKELTDIGITSARLDAEIILSYVLEKQRPFLHAHPEFILKKNIIKSVEPILKLRLKRVPVAYLIGKKEFYGREFIVNSDVLIPRPESEDIIDTLKSILSSTDYYLSTTNLIDVGTGCGCLGITAKLELPNINVILSDIDKKALLIAKRNAKNYKAQVSTFTSDLLDNIDQEPDIILANLPYIDRSWTCSHETIYEPNHALFAKDNGLDLINNLIIQSKHKLKKNGLLILEADPCQHKDIINRAKENSFYHAGTLNYAVALTKRFNIDTVK